MDKISRNITHAFIFINRFILVTTGMLDMRLEYTPDEMPQHRRSTSISKGEINQTCFSFRSDKIFFSYLKDSVWSSLTVTGEFISACKALVEGACQFMSSFHSWKWLRVVLINSLTLSKQDPERESALPFTTPVRMPCFFRQGQSVMPCKRLTFSIEDFRNAFYSCLFSSARLELVQQYTQLVKF